MDVLLLGEDSRCLRATVSNPRELSTDITPSVDAVSWCLPPTQAFFGMVADRSDAASAWVAAISRLTDSSPASRSLFEVSRVILRALYLHGWSRLIAVRIGIKH